MGGCMSRGPPNGSRRLSHMADESSTAMASEQGLPPPAPTTIIDIGDDLLREIFLRLPSLPSLVRAALACRTFLHAVRSSPAFRRCFQALHPPQLLGFFRDPCRPCIPLFSPLRGRSDPDHTAVIRGADFFLTGLTEDSAHYAHWWEMESCHGGYIVLVNITTDQIAAYNPVTQALDIFPLPPEEILLSGSSSLEFHIVFSEEDLGVFRMVCVQHGSTSEMLEFIAVFSSANREWQVLPRVETPQPENDGTPPMPRQPEDDGDDMLTFDAGTQLNGLIYWKHASQGNVLVLNTVTLEFSTVVLPALLGEKGSKLFTLGHTKDGKLCVVGADDSDANIGTLFVWFWEVDDDIVDKWMLEDTFPLSTLVDEYDATVHVDAVIDGFVYLSAKYVEQRESLLSLCLETNELNILFDETYASPAHPYIMAWPVSLICNKRMEQEKLQKLARKGPSTGEQAPSTPSSAASNVKAGGGAGGSSTSAGVSTDKKKYAWRASSLA